MNGASIRRFLSFALAISFIAWAGYTISTRSEELPRLTWTLPSIVLAVIATWTAVLVNGAIAEQAARRVGSATRFCDWASIGFASTLLNYFLPLKAGSFFRLAAYARFSGRGVLPLGSAFVVSTIFMQVVFCVTLISVLFASRRAGWEQAAFALLVALALVGVMYAVGRVGTGWHRSLKQFYPGIAAWTAAGTKPLLQLMLFALLLLAVTVLRYAGIAALLALDVGWTVLMILACVGSMSTLISVTFGGLGVREAVIVIAARLAGMNEVDALTFALLDRVIVSIAILPVGLACLAYLRPLLSSRRHVAPPPS